MNLIKLTIVSAALLGSINLYANDNVNIKKTKISSNKHYGEDKRHCNLSNKSRFENTNNKIEVAKINNGVHGT